MKKNSSNTYKVKSNMTKSMIEDLEKQHGFDLVQRLEDILVITLVRRNKLSKILSKI